MGWKCDVAGITVSLDIKGYKPFEDIEEEECWCECDYSFSSGDWLNIHHENDEVLTNFEVVHLEQCLSKLLNNFYDENCELGFIEPDFTFKMFPMRKMSKSSEKMYDVFVRWELAFWERDSGLTDNFLSITLGREEIESLRDYLTSVIVNK